MRIVIGLGKRRYVTREMIRVGLKVKIIQLVIMNKSLYLMISDLFSMNSVLPRNFL